MPPSLLRLNNPNLKGIVMETKLSKQLSYCIGIITHNSLDRLLPIAPKNSQGIDLAIWSIAFRRCGIIVKLQDYIHKTYSQQGYSEDIRQEIVLL